MPLARQWDLAAAILFAKIDGHEPEEVGDKPDETEVETDKKKAGEPDGSITPEPLPTA